MFALTKTIQHSLANTSSTLASRFLGAIPYDHFLASKRLNEVMEALDARLLYGQDVSTHVIPITSVLVATSHLEHLLHRIGHQKKSHSNTGVLIVTAFDRSDLLFGLLMAKFSGNLPTVAGIVLTCADSKIAVTSEVMQSVEKILVDLANLPQFDASFPIFKVTACSYETAVRLNALESDILPTSRRKIE